MHVVRRLCRPSPHERVPELRRGAGEEGHPPKGRPSARPGSRAQPSEHHKAAHAILARGNCCIHGEAQGRPRTSPLKLSPRPRSGEQSTDADVTSSSRRSVIALQEILASVPLATAEHEPTRCRAGPGYVALRCGLGRRERRLAVVWAHNHVGNRMAANPPTRFRKANRRGAKGASGSATAQLGARYVAFSLREGVVRSHRETASPTGGRATTASARGLISLSHRRLRKCGP